MAIVGALESAGRVAGGSNLRAASSASGIGRLDHGTEKCADGLFLSANASCLDCVCRRADETALAILWAGSDPLSPGAFGQDDSLHAASGAVLDFMVAEEAHQLEESFPDRSPFLASPWVY